MKLSYIAGFVHQCALDANANFSLDGEKIGPKDLADEHALLPLVVAAANTIHEQISGTRSSHLQYLEPADPNTYLLGWRVKALPDFPEAALLLYINNAIREHLPQAPAPRLPNPTAPRPMPIPGQPSELRQHLNALGLAPAAPSMERGSDPTP